MSSRSGPIRAMVRPRSLTSNDTSTSSSHAATVSSITSSRPPLSKHSRHCSLESLTSSLSHRHTINNSGRAGTMFTNASHHHHHQQPLQQGVVKSASTGHLACHTSSHSVSSSTANTSQCLKDFCPPLNAARLRPIKHQTRNTTVSSQVL